MNKFIRYFNQNRRKIISIIVAIVFALIILQFANYLATTSSQRASNIIVKESETTVKNNINTESAITGGTGGETSKTETEIIEQFIQYCNKGKPTEAYNMLSIECKENMYSSLEQFITTYYKDNFRESKSYNIQRWSGSTYKIDFKENMLHTGTVTSGGKQDYITVVSEDKEYKLNINNYIGRTELNKQNTVDNIYIQVLYKDTSMNDETYTFEIKNNNDIDIYLDNLESTSTIYLVDENNVKHVAYVNEMAEEQLHIYSYAKNEIQIRFSNSYITGRKYSKIVFENVIFDEKNNESKEISISLQ